MVNLDSLRQFREIMVNVVQNNRLFVFYHIRDWINGNVVHQENDPDLFTPTPGGAHFEDHPLTSTGLRSKKYHFFLGLLDLSADLLRNIAPAMNVSVVAKTRCTFL